MEKKFNISRYNGIITGRAELFFRYVERGKHSYGKLLCNNDTSDKKLYVGNQDSSVDKTSVCILSFENNSGSKLTKIEAEDTSGNRKELNYKLNASDVTGLTFSDETDHSFNLIPIDFKGKDYTPLYQAGVWYSFLTEAGLKVPISVIRDPSVTDLFNTSNIFEKECNIEVAFIPVENIHTCIKDGTEYKCHKISTISDLSSTSKVNDIDIDYHCDVIPSTSCIYTSSWVFSNAQGLSSYSKCKGSERCGDNGCLGFATKMHPHCKQNEDGKFSRYLDQKSGEYVPFGNKQTKLEREIEVGFYKKKKSKRDFSLEVIIVFLVLFLFYMLYHM